jgi:REP element-mobilizing transposase RayT
LPRKRRIDAPSTLHHIWARGVLRRRIFVDDHDRSALRDLLTQVLVPSNARAVAWTFMTNHVHLVLRSGDVPLSTVMRLVLSEYALRFNERHERSGHLFQGRFGSRQIAGDADFLTIVRYVHRNPLEAGMVRDLSALEGFAWSGHASLMGRRSPLAFELPSLVLDRFGADAAAARERLVEWMGQVDEGAATAFDVLVRNACRRRGVSEADVFGGSRTRASTEARTEICHRGVRDLGLTQREVARRLGVTEMAVCIALRRAVAD